jgi:hypothetical protein
VVKTDKESRERSTSEKERKLVNRQKVRARNGLTTDGVIERTGKT